MFYLLLLPFLFLSVMSLSSFSPHVKFLSFFPSFLPAFSFVPPFCSFFLARRSTSQKFVPRLVLLISPQSLFPLWSGRPFLDYIPVQVGLLVKDPRFQRDFRILLLFILSLFSFPPQSSPFFFLLFHGDFQYFLFPLPSSRRLR